MFLNHTIHYLFIFFFRNEKEHRYILTKYDNKTMVKTVN